MFLVDVCPKIVDQSRVINRESFPVGRFDIDHQVVWGSVKRGSVMFFSVAQVDRSRRFLRISEARAVTNHLTLIATGEKREAVRVRRTRESEEAIAINSRVTDEHFIQVFAAHAFDRITPKAFHFSNDAHCSILPRKTTATVKSIRDSPESLSRRSQLLDCQLRPQSTTSTS